MPAIDGPPPSPQTTWETLRKARPEVLIISTPVAHVPLLLTQLADMALQPGWWNIPAVYNSNVFVVDEALFNRPSPRVVDGVRVLAGILAPPSGGGESPLPPKTCWKLSMKVGHRCRAKLLPNYFLPYGVGPAPRDSYERS